MGLRPFRMVCQIECYKRILDERRPPRVHPFAELLAHVEDATLLGVRFWLLEQVTSRVYRVYRRDKPMVGDATIFMRNLPVRTLTFR